MIVAVQNGTRESRKRILSSPLFLFYSTFSNVQKIFAEQIAGQFGKSASALFGGASQPEQKQENYVHPILGSTPQPKTRDEYFDIISGIRGR